jgi:hypothetical protein
VKGAHRFLTWNGETRCVRDWARIIGLNYATLLNRINKLGWSAEEALANKKDALKHAPRSARKILGRMPYRRRARPIFGMSPERAAILGLIDAEEYLGRYK